MIGHKLKVDGMEINRIFKTATIVFAATAFGTALKFAANLLAAKTLPLEDYGAFSFIFSTMLIFAALAPLGFVYVILKFVPEFSAKGEKQRASSAVFYSFAITLATALVFALAVFFLSPWISQTFLHTLAYENYLKLYKIGDNKFV